MAKTQPEAVIFARSQIDHGYGTDLKGVSNTYEKQCVAWVSYYYTWLGFESIMKNNAIDLWRSVNSPNWTKVPASQGAHTGDIFVMQTSFSKYGHTGVVIDLIPGGIVSTDQNWVNPDLDHGSNIARVNHLYSSGILGFLRPNFAQGDDMTIKDRNEARNMWFLVFHQWPTDQQADSIIGKDANQLKDMWLPTPQWQTYNDYIAFGGARVGQIDSLTQSVGQLTQEVQQLKTQPDEASLQSVKTQAANIQKNAADLQAAVQALTKQ